MSAHADTTVLVVEDEPLLRMMAVDILEDAGFAVEEASDSGEARRVMTARPDLHVLFTDIHVPGDMNGLSLAHWTASTLPHVGLIIVSGRGAPRSHEMPRGATFIPKPYEAEKLVRHVHRARPLRT